MFPGVSIPKFLMTDIGNPSAVWSAEVLEKVGIELIKQMIYSDFFYMLIFLGLGLRFLIYGFLETIGMRSCSVVGS